MPVNSTAFNTKVSGRTIQHASFATPDSTDIFVTIGTDFLLRSELHIHLGRRLVRLIRVQRAIYYANFATRWSVHRQAFEATNGGPATREPIAPGRNAKFMVGLPV